MFQSLFLLDYTSYNGYYINELGEIIKIPVSILIFTGLYFLYRQHSIDGQENLEIARVSILIFTGLYFLS